jgi:hypothetical protein
MSQHTPRNIQSGVPAAETTTDDGPAVASAARRDGVHYEPDDDQVVRVVHQVKPATLPAEGPTDYDDRGGADDTSTTDVAVTPTSASVWQALPDEPKDEGE